ncbi:MAG TPA: polyprenyl synthetase family protein [Candidatus Saccharimonadales bacterium]|nr:polyprenyl synthetase family protein [Candidatus Saccharimonadales bacterium]
MKPASPSAPISSESTFAARLKAYKQTIDNDIAIYSKHVAAVTRDQYGEYGALTTGVFLDILQRGGKRIRGTLAMVGYEMCGGKDRVMIARAASALEMMHAYLLIIDDIQDRSALRRGKPSAHELLAAYHTKQHLDGDAAHMGISLALNAGLAGMHAAQMLLAGLQVDPELRIKAIGIINHTMVITSHGQTYDIMNELTPEVDMRDIAHALEWKTAHYTFLNPLCTGMALAGAGCEATDAIRDYALHAGLAFQIADDIISVFGDQTKTGKVPMDDIREGKRTLLTAYALAHATSRDKTFLLRCLGNQKLTKQDFDHTKEILEQSGALAAAKDAAEKHIATALKSLDANRYHWHPDGVTFLRDLAQQVLGRSA